MSGPDLAVGGTDSGRFLVCTERRHRAVLDDVYDRCTQGRRSDYHANGLHPLDAGIPCGSE